MQVFDVFEASIGNSLAVNKLLKNYDHTVVSDFLKIHGASITPLVGQLRWLLIIYPVFAVLLDAGLLACAATSKRGSWRRFWRGGADYFFPFLKIALVFLGLALLWSAMIWLPVMTYLEPSLEYFYTEAYSVWGMLAVAVVYFFGLMWLFAWSLLARLWKMRSEEPIWVCLRQGLRLLRKKRGRVLGLLGLFAALQITLLAGYALLDCFTGMTSAGWIFALFLVQQCLVFFRIQVRQMVYAGVAREALSRIKQPFGSK